MEFNLTPSLLRNVLDMAYAGYQEYEEEIAEESDEAYLCGEAAKECRAIAKEFCEPLDKKFAAEAHRWLELAETFEQKAEALEG